MRLLILLLALITGCAHARPSPPPAGPPLAEGARLERDHGVLVYRSRPWGFDTNSFFLEGPEGLVMIDTQFLPSAAEEAVEAAQARTGKEVVLAIVLHPNPDKFNGTALLQARGIRVVTSAEVATTIPEVHALRSRWFHDRYAPDYPEAVPAPEITNRARLEVAGLELTLHRLGPGCSHAHLAVAHEGHLFVGDLVASGTHAWLELGLLEAWHERLDELEALSPTAVHPGRGRSGGPAVIAEQRRYLRAVTAEVASAQAANLDRDRGVERAKQALIQRYPERRYRVFLELGLPAVWRR